MKAYRLNLIRIGILLFALLLLSAATVSPALAVDKPAINVSVVWRPATQLTTIDHDVAGGGAGINVWEDYEPDGNYYGPADDDFRYVEAEIYVTTSVPFWAVDLTCEVDPAVLVGYSDVDTSGSPVEDHDDRPMLVWGGEWYDRGGPSEAGTSGVYNGATGEMDLTATLTGSWHEPLGFYGYTDTFLLATLRYKTASLAASDDTDIKCTGRFLDRDGNDVAKPKFAKGTSLEVLTGYTINGTITYQAYPKPPKGSEAFADCIWDLGGGGVTWYRGYADSKGLWSITTRQRGHYDCFFKGRIPNSSGKEQHLMAREGTEMSWDQYSEWYTDFYFLPVELKAGNVDITLNAGCYSDYRGGPGHDVEALDLGVVTSSYEINADGDANGDGATDEEDLAIVGGNYGYCEDDYVDHLIYDLPRDYDDHVNSRVWLGSTQPQGSGVTQLVPGPKEGRDLWATLSPDGSQVAFVRSAYDKKSGSTRYGLYVADVASGKPKVTAILPKDFTENAFAPSWSPDGQRIAFVCSSASGGTGYKYDNGYLCLIDADGGNFQRPILRHDSGYIMGTTIWPPAWNGTNELLFADHVNIYRYFLDSGTFALLDDPDIPGNSANDIPDGSDMPIVRGDQLLYRYDDGSPNRILHWARFNCDTPGYPCFVDPFESTNVGIWTGYPHTWVSYWDTGMGMYLPISTDVDYYETEARNIGIVLYETGGYEFWFHWVDTWHGTWPNDWPEWGATGSPVWVIGGKGNPWCGSGPPCDLFALRNTIDWAQHP
jgi:hypothetical protein